MHICKQAAFVLVVGCFEILIFLIAIPSMAYASPDTVVTEDIHSDTVWNREDSPYILAHDIHVDPGVSLTIGPGVKVAGQGSRPGALVVQGTLLIVGSSTKAVEFSGSGGLVIESATATIVHAYFHDGFGIHGLHAVISIASSTFMSTNGTAIRMDGGIIQAANLRIENSSAYGIIAAAFAPPSRPEDSPVLDVHHSSFIGNALGAVYNSYSDITHFEDNWWGSAAGPSRSGPNSIRGPVYYEPVLDHDPTDPSDLPSALCCSSILFIPGLEGTRLYDVSHTLLWEPVGNANILKLMLDRNGSSTERIISGEPIDFALGLTDIYGKFMRFMDGLVSSGIIHEWKSFGYDWRDLPDRTALRDQDRGTTTDTLVARLNDLAARSQTGKVTVIAHSNGGLVAKYLVKLLSDSGQADIVDTLISVATPYLGAPEALAALLHGDHQSIAGGLFAAKTSMRDLGLNMPSAYGLLPSLTYFLKSLGPTVVFGSTTMHGINDGSYPGSIRTSQDQRNFVLDGAGIRDIPTNGDVSAPAIGNAALLSAADALHTILDTFDWPMSLIRWAVFGWNRDTTTAIEYKMRPGCDGFLGTLWCRTTQYIHRLATSLLGDGTVPVQSALYGSDHAVSIDLGAVSGAENADFSHANILESSTTQNIIRKIVTSPRGTTPALSGIPDVSTRAPLEAGEPPRLDLTLHGNARISVFDENGSDVSTKHTTVTGSGEGMYTEVQLPYGYGHMYSVVIHGNGYGFFTVGVERIVPGQTADRAQFVTMPLSPIMVATTTIDTAAADETDGPIAALLPVLSVDVDNNGGADYAATADGNGLPGNAATAEDADRIAREQTIDVLTKTETPALRADPERIELMNQLFPPGTNGPLPGASGEQKTPPISGSASCPSPQ